MFSKTFIFGLCIAATLTQAIDVVADAETEQKKNKKSGKGKGKTKSQRSVRTGSSSARVVEDEDEGDVNPMDTIGYFKSDEYQDKFRDEKMKDLWQMITEDDTMLDYYWAEFNQIFTNKPGGSFCQDSDEMQKNRLKTTHTQGLVAKVSWVPVQGNGYTGFYASQSDHNIIRFSQTTNLIDEVSQGLLPSLALKFLIDR